MSILHNKENWQKGHIACIGSYEMVITVVNLKKTTPIAIPEQ